MGALASTGTRRLLQSGCLGAEPLPARRVDEAEIPPKTSRLQVAASKQRRLFGIVNDSVHKMRNQTPGKVIHPMPTRTKGETR
jgi:hypothetical protein